MLDDIVSSIVDTQEKTCPYKYRSSFVKYIDGKISFNIQIVRKGVGAIYNRGYSTTIITDPADANIPMVQVRLILHDIIVYALDKMTEITKLMIKHEQEIQSRKEGGAVGGS